MDTTPLFFQSLFYFMGVVGIEPTASFLSGTRSTTELHALVFRIAYQKNAARANAAATNNTPRPDGRGVL